MERCLKRMKNSIMKKLLIALCSVLFLCSCAEQPTKPKHEFRFNEDGKFKIAQLTDIHIHPGDPKSNPVPDTI